MKKVFWLLIVFSLFSFNILAEKKVIKYSNGDIYEGNIEKGDQNGFGKYTWKNGDVYEGDWVDGNRTGFGKYTWKNGNVYKGEWLKGNRHGFGLEAGNISFWKDNVLNGIQTSFDIYKPYSNIFKNDQKIDSLYKGSDTGKAPDYEGYVLKFIEGYNVVGSEKNLISKKDVIDNIVDYSNNFIWELNNSDFNHGYFDYFYENGFLMAIPSILEEPEIIEYTSLPKESKKRNYDYFKEKVQPHLIYPKGTYPNNIELIIYPKYQSFLNLKGWRYPSDSEVYKSSLLSSLLKEKFHSNSYAASVFAVTTVVYATGVWTVGWDYKGDTTNPNMMSPIGQVIPIYVNPLNVSLKRIILNEKTSIKDKILEVAIYLTTQENINTEKKKIDYPTLYTIPEQPIFTKEEFETTKNFESRKKEGLDKWKLNADSLKSKNEVILKNYNESLNNNDIEFRNEIESFKSPKNIVSMYEKNLKNAFSIVLGKPFLRDISYDADTETMAATVYSLQDSSISYPIKIPVSLEKAKKYRQDLIDRIRIPKVIFDQNFNIVKIDIVYNDAKTAYKYSEALKKNTIQDYNAFIATYPEAKEVMLAKENILKIQNDQKAKQEAELKAKQEAELKAKQEAELKAKEEAKVLAEKQKRYNMKKNVGDQIKKEISYDSVGLFIRTTKQTTLIAVVEQVSGNRIQIKIINTGGFNGTINNGLNQIYQNSIFWDDFDNWMK